MGNWTPSIVPGGRSQTIYLVLNDFGKFGRSYPKRVRMKLTWKQSSPACSKVSIAIRSMSLPSMRQKNGPETSLEMSSTRFAIVAIDRGSMFRRIFKHS